MKLVIIESPFQNCPENVAYAQAAMANSLELGEAPYASHLLYPQCLNDANEKERQQGMMAGWEWMGKADLVAIYVDKGITPGMAAGIKKAAWYGKPMVVRSLKYNFEMPVVWKP